MFVTIVCTSFHFLPLLPLCIFVRYVFDFCSENCNSFICGTLTPVSPTVNCQSKYTYVHSYSYLIKWIMNDPHLKHTCKFAVTTFFMKTQVVLSVIRGC